jgi:hypothetical protein
MHDTVGWWYGRPQWELNFPQVENRAKAEFLVLEL